MKQRPPQPTEIFQSPPSCLRLLTNNSEDHTSNLILDSRLKKKKSKISSEIQHEGRYYEYVHALKTCEVTVRQDKVTKPGTYAETLKKRDKKETH